MSMEKKRTRPRLSKDDNDGTTPAPEEVFDVAVAQGQLLDELAKLSRTEYETRRQQAAQRLGWRVSILDKEVEHLREAAEAEEELKRQPVFLNPIEPWPTPVNGAKLASKLLKAINKYCVLPKHADVAVALWVLHAHAHDAATTSPILCLSSPQKRCGKTTILGLVQRLTPRAIRADNVSSAVVFRAIDRWYPTLLIDEADTFIKPNQELRGVLDSGHLRDGFILRCVGDDHEPRPFSTWAPKAIALIGQLPPTLEDRAIVIKVQRKLPSETSRHLQAGKNPFVDIGRKIVRWAADNMEALRDSQPRTLKALHDRARDNWRPLFAIAERLGPEWKQRAQSAARALEREVEEETDSVFLLKDIALWFEKRERRDRFPSEDMCEWLGKREDRPWPEYGRAGKRITTRGMARLLKPFGIRPRVIKIEGVGVRGYMREDFEDAFRRYTPHRATP